MPDFAHSKQATGLRFLWLTLLLFVIDQVTKIWVAGEFELYESRVVIEGLFNFTYVHNYGAAFSFLSDSGGWQRWLFTAIAVAISVVLLIWMRRNPVGLWRQNLAFALILAGRDRQCCRSLDVRLCHRLFRCALSRLALASV